MSILGHRFTAVVAGAAVITTLGATGAVAADLITGADVQNESLTGADVRNGTLRPYDFNDNVRAYFAGINTRSAANQSEIEDLWAAVEEIGGEVFSSATLFVEDGAKEMDALSLSTYEPIPLAEFDAPKFTQGLVAGNGDFGANVILSLDVDGDGDAPTFEDIERWHVGANASDPALLDGDAIVQMDGADPHKFNVDTATINRWYATKLDGTAFGAEYGSLETIKGLERLSGADVVDVHYVIGGSPNWNNIALKVTTK
jgi:hypothetical protein